MARRPTRAVPHALADLVRADESAAARWFPLVYAELHHLASRQLAHERRGHTLQTTALLNEAYVKLARREDLEGLDERSFLAVAARAMRRVLVDHARRNAARGRNTRRPLLPEEAKTFDADERTPLDLVAMDDALDRLAKLSPRQASVVELRFFGGITMDDVAKMLGVSKRTVEGDWAIARAWLRNALGGSAV